MTAMQPYIMTGQFSDSSGLDLNICLGCFLTNVNMKYCDKSWFNGKDSTLNILSEYFLYNLFFLSFRPQIVR